MRTTRLPPSPCPGCGSPNDAATDPEGGARPSPGDFGVCLSCGTVAVYGADLRLAPVPPGTRLPDEVRQMVARWHQEHRARFH